MKEIPKMAGATFFPRPHYFLGLSKPLVDSELYLETWHFWGPGGACFALYRSSQGGGFQRLVFFFGFLKEERDVDVQIPMPRLNPLIPQKNGKVLFVLLALRKDEAVVHSLS